MYFGSFSVFVLTDVNENRSTAFDQCERGNDLCSNGVVKPIFLPGRDKQDIAHNSTQAERGCKKRLQQKTIFIKMILL